MHSDPHARSVSESADGASVSLILLLTSLIAGPLHEVNQFLLLLSCIHTWTSGSDRCDMWSEFADMLAATSSDGSALVGAAMRWNITGQRKL
jgi:hypothetical protein